jgi:hypothetical protein
MHPPMPTCLLCLVKQFYVEVQQGNTWTTFKLVGSNPTLPPSLLSFRWPGLPAEDMWGPADPPAETKISPPFDYREAETQPLVH